MYFPNRMVAYSAYN